MPYLSGAQFRIMYTVPVASATEKIFTAYVVEIATEFGTVTLTKRYRQFLSLHKTVMQPGCEDFIRSDDAHQQLKEIYKDLPTFPKKRYLRNNTAPKFIQHRCQKLADYMNRVINYPGILDVEEMRIFVTTTLSAKGALQTTTVGSCCNLVATRGNCGGALGAIKGSRIQVRIDFPYERTPKTNHRDRS